MTRIYFTLIFLMLMNAVKSEDSKYVAPSLFVNHGGGPLPILGDQDELEIAEGMRNVSQYVDFSRLKAFIVVTAHRQENVVTISSGKHHNLLYDYSFFPPESYQFQYNASGDPILAARIHEAFKDQSIPSRLDNKRGWDHGVFIPMMLINPIANIPVIQISILKNHNSEQHYDIGRVLNQFRKDGVAIIGSGMSYHNMEEFFKADVKNNRLIVNDIFDNFLIEVCTGDTKQKYDILNWKQVPGAVEAHPLGLEDHLMPLIVNVGASGLKPGKHIFHSVYVKKFKLSGFLWDDE